MSRVTAEGSQDAPNAPSAQGASRQPMGNQQLRIAILVVVAALVGVGLWLAFGNSKHKKKGPANLTTAILPISLSKNQLLNKASNAGQPIYWIGPKRHYHYEFRRLTNKYIYIRYLPKGVKVHGEPGKLIIVATYPWQHAYAALKKANNGRGVAGKDGSFIIPSRPGDTKSVLMAWPHGSYEVEVFDPTPGKAAAIAASGQVASVAG
jgi:hypothetical protein